MFVRKSIRRNCDIRGQDGKKKNVLKSTSELTLKQKAFVDIYVSNWGEITKVEACKKSWIQI